MYIKQVRWKINHHLIAYSLTNICTQNYWNQTTTVKITVGGLVPYLFGDTVYTEQWIGNVWSHTYPVFISEDLYCLDVSEEWILLLESVLKSEKTLVHRLGGVRHSLQRRHRLVQVVLSVTCNMFSQKINNALLVPYTFNCYVSLVYCADILLQCVDFGNRYGL